MGSLEDYRAPAQVKLAALWASTMFCYVYGDYFGLFVPGALAEMNRGILGPLGPATASVLVGVAAMMAIPSVMIFLSLVLPPAFCRWCNMALGIAYTAIVAITMPGSPAFYILLGFVEMALTLTIVAVAWRWPREVARA